MPEVTMDISRATSSDMESAVEDVSIATQTTDAAGEQDETRWHNSRFTQYFGYYKKIPEVKTAIDTRATWTVGKGYKADVETSIILDHIKGWGKESFNDILRSMIIIRRTGGDAFAEIIRDAKTGTLLNLKPLDPASIDIIADRKGMLKRYEQIAKSGNKTFTTKFDPDEIFHLVNKRAADEIHGTSDIEAIEPIILANKECFDDMRKLMHRYVKPIMAFKLDTDNQTKINAFIVKMDEVINKGENIYIPKGTVEFELVAVPANATLNPLPWREHLKNNFFQVVGIPQIIMGSSGEFTEATAKIAYTAFMQSVEEEQLNIEEEIWNQLYLRIELSFPFTMRNELISDESKDAAQGMEWQQSDMAAGAG